MNKQRKFIVKDWAGNRCFPDKVFSSFEDGWEFLYAQFPVIAGNDREDELGEYYVIEITNN